MAEGKKSAILYCDLIHTVEKLTDDQAGRLFKHYLRYINDLNPVADDVLTEIAFEPIKQSLKRDLVKWEKRADRSRENGKKGGRPTKTQTEPKKPSGLINNPDEPRKPDSVSVSVSVSVSDIKKDIFNKWLDYRRQIKKPVKVESTLSALAKRFNENTLDKCEWVVNNSIENNYQGLFWDNYKQQNKNNTGSTPFASPIL